MANTLTAVFELIDRMSDKMDAIANRGDEAVARFEAMGDAADQAFDGAEAAADGVVSAVSSYSTAAEGAASKTDFWTDAVGNYDRSALEAIYTTEELVDMGLKSAEALEHEADIMAQCDKAAQELSDAMQESSRLQEKYTSVLEQANSVMEEVADNDKVSAETKEALQEATEQAAQAFEELEEAQNAAQAAMDEYDAVLSSGTASLDEIEAAAQNAANAADDLEDANKKAADATEELERASTEAADEVEDVGEKGKEAFETLSQAMAAAGITKAVQEMAEAFLDAAQAAATAETAFAKLETIAGGSNMDMLTAQIKELSAETGIAQADLADVAYNAISAGTAVEEAVSVASAASKLATAGFTETSSALSVLSTAMNSYGDAAGTAEEISNSLIMVQNLGVTTVADLAASMGKSISTAAAYGVTLGNLESAYVSVTKAGINTAEATTYISGMMQELGKEGSTVSTILSEQTGQSFGELMASGYTLADVLEIIYDAAGNDAEAMMNLWSSQTAGVASAAIVNQGLDQFNANLEAIEESAGATESAYSIMADTTEYAQQRMATSTENLKIAIGDSLTPALEKVNNVGATAFEWAAEFAEEHPVFIKVITAVAVAVGVAAVAISGYTLATTVAIPALKAFGAALNTALGPIGWVAIAVTGITAGVAAFVALLDNSEDEYNSWTKTTQQQYDALQELNGEYERACETYGETSEEALRLKYQVDDATAAFEASKQTVEEFTAEVEEMCSSVYEIADAWDEAKSAADNTEVGTLALIQKYEDLSTQTELTAAQESQLAAVTQELEALFPDLVAQYDDAATSTIDYVEAMKQAAALQAEQEKQAAAQETYVEALKKQAELAEELEKAQANLNAEMEATGYYYDEMGRLTNGTAYEGSLWTSWTTDINDYKEAVDELNAAIAENDAVLAEVEGYWQDVSDAEAEAEEAGVSYEDAVSTALESVQEDLEELITAYDEAYESARSSVDGQIGLFDEMATETELSVKDMQDAFASQLEYLQTYTENLKLAAEYGIDEGLIASLSDGSAESAGYINAIVENIQNLGEGTEAAQSFVDSFNTSFQEVEQAKDEFATQVAEMETNFDERMNEIETRLTESIEEMNKEGDAAAAAKATIDAYAQAIRDGEESATAAAKAVASAVTAALQSANTSVNVSVTSSGASRGYAVGTMSAAPGLALVGENGPELINFGGGEVVYTADETEQILNNYTNNNDNSSVVTVENEDSDSRDNVFYLPADSGRAREDASAGGGISGDRKITLEIEGKGNIQLQGGKVDEETMLAFLYEYLKPVLSEILTQEIYEEGDYSYGY